MEEISKKYDVSYMHNDDGTITSWIHQTEYDNLPDDVKIMIKLLEISIIPDNLIPHKSQE